MTPSDVETAPHKPDDGTCLPSKSWRADGAEIWEGFGPGNGISKQLTPAVEFRGEDDVDERRYPTKTLALSGPTDNLQAETAIPAE